MNDNSTNTELLIRYIDGELEETEKDALETRIRTEAPLREELENLRLAKDAMNSYGLKNTISSIHTEMMETLNKETVPRIGNTRRILQYSARIAAVAIIVLGMITVYQYITATPENLFNDRFHAFNLHEARGTTAVSLMEEAYKKGDADAVIQQFHQIPNPNPEDYFLAGNAFLMLHKPADAIKNFLALQKNNADHNTHLYEEDAEYYLALSYLDNKEISKALPLFEKIHADENHPYHSNVTGWFLRKLHWANR